MNFHDYILFGAMIALVVGAVGNIFALLRHERREFARADAKDAQLREDVILREAREQERHDVLLREVRDMNHVIRGIIAQRTGLEQRLTAVEMKLQNHEHRLVAVETGHEVNDP